MPTAAEIQHFNDVRVSAEAGNVVAMNDLGFLYAKGRGTAKNYKEAMNWYLLAAEAGDAVAMSNIGAIYYYGDYGQYRNHKISVEWYRKAAAAGNAYAMYSLGWAYKKGEGVRTNPAEAVKWFQKAAAAGNGEGILELAIAYEQGYGGLSKDKDRARQLFESAAKLGVKKKPGLFASPGVFFGYFIDGLEDIGADVRSVGQYFTSDTLASTSAASNSVADSVGSANQVAISMPVRNISNPHEFQAAIYNSYRTAHTQVHIKRHDNRDDVVELIEFTEFVSAPPVNVLELVGFSGPYLESADPALPAPLTPSAPEPESEEWVSKDEIDDLVRKAREQIAKDNAAAEKFDKEAPHAPSSMPIAPERRQALARVQ